MDLDLAGSSHLAKDMGMEFVKNSILPLMRGVAPQNLHPLSDELRTSIERHFLLPATNFEYVHQLYSAMKENFDLLTPDLQWCCESGAFLVPEALAISEVELLYMRDAGIDPRIANLFHRGFPEADEPGPGLVL